ncbi:MAG: hypothetical protein AAB683_01670, partial [Patescibacteria group bacterium]
IPVLGTGDSGFESRRSDKIMFKKIFIFFDKFEDKVRRHLSRFPIVYTLLGGIAIVLFWRGIWHTADILQAKGGFFGFIFYEPINTLIVTFILLATGLFVSSFIGDAILVSGLKQQKKLHEKTEKEVREGEATLNEIQDTVMEIKKEVEEIREVVENESSKKVKEKEINNIDI